MRGDLYVIGTRITSRYLIDVQSDDIDTGGRMVVPASAASRATTWRPRISVEQLDLTVLTDRLTMVDLDGAHTLTRLSAPTMADIDTALKLYLGLP